MEYLKSIKILLENNKLSEKALLILEDYSKLFVTNKVNLKKKYLTDEFLKNLQEFRDIFPNMKLPSGKSARTNFDDLKKKMIDFHIKYSQYDWDTILDAATHYVETYRKDDYRFMKTAGYYVMKNNESDLASDCELLLEGGLEELQKKSYYTVR